MNRAFFYDNIKGIPVDGDKMILWRVHYMLRTVIGEYWSKPLFSCVWCMASFWSLPIFFPFMIYWKVELYLIIYLWMIYVPVVSTMAGYLDTKIEQL